MIENKKAKSKWGVYFLSALVIIAIAMKAWSYYLPKAYVIFGDKKIPVLVAKNYQNLYKGLSGRTSLGEYGGMIFVFPDRSQHTMVMREMKMPIDIIWLDYDRVVDIAPNLQPDPSKNNYDLIKYNARAVSTMVLETPAGWALASGLKIGDIINIKK